MSPSKIIWRGQSGCLLPLLIIFNLFFGREIFRSTYLWLGIEAGLVLLFIIKMHIFAQKITQQFRPEGHKLRNDKVIDVEGKVVEEKQKEVE